MSTPLDQILNYAGSKHPVRGDMKRAHRTSVSFRGTQLDCEYFTDGTFMAATDTDHAEYPICNLKSVEINGADVTRLLEEFRDEIEQRIEAGWKR